MKISIIKIRERSWTYRNKFGQFYGLRVWAQMENAAGLKKGKAYRVRVPRIKFPITLRAHTSDALVFEQIFMNDEASVPVRNYPSFIVDVGANIGLTSIAYANRFPKSAILAIEMEASNFKLLLENTRNYPNITCINKALWHSSERLEIANPSDEEWAFQVRTSSSFSASSIETITLDEVRRLSPSGRIDLLKIDIEGAELDVLNHSDKEWISYVHTLAIELHDRFRPGCSEALVNAIRGRTKSRITHGEYEVVELS